MTIKELSENTGFKLLACNDPSAMVTGVFCSDMPSEALASADEGTCWVTVLSNINVLAVAKLRGCSCVCLAAGADPGRCTRDSELAERAKKEGVTLLASPLPTYETSIKLYESLKLT